MPFNHEALVRALARRPWPVVSGVGHETDVTLCDLVADVRASTPTAAARLVVPDIGELRNELERSRARLERGARHTFERHAHRLTQTRDRLRRAPTLLVERRRARLEQTAGRLRALSPRATLQRGYAIVRSGDRVIGSSAGLRAGERVDVELAEGSFGARVEDVRR
jgi:exodeoxyribonuclease VII large subunit